MNSLRDKRSISGETSCFRIFFSPEMRKIPKEMNIEKVTQRYIERANNKSISTSKR